MKNVIILKKTTVDRHYHYWDTYRYDMEQLKLQAIAQYLRVSEYSIDFKEFKDTYHVWVLF